MQFIIVPSSCPNRRPPAPKPPRAWTPRLRATHLLSHPFPTKVAHRHPSPLPITMVPICPLFLWLEHWGRDSPYLRPIFSSVCWAFSPPILFLLNYSPLSLSPLPCLLLEEGGGLDLRPPVGRVGTLPLDSFWLSVLVSRDLVDSARTLRGEGGIAFPTEVKGRTKKSSHFKSDLSPAWRANSRK